MVQDVGVVATRFFESVCEDRQAVEGPVLVNVSGEFDHFLRDLVRVNGHYPERVSEDATENSSFVRMIFGLEKPETR